MKKKVLSMVLAAIMILSFAACSANPANGGKIANADPLTRDDVIQIVIGSHASWPYREDWKIWEYIEEACGATLDVVAYPSSEGATKIPLMFAAPDTLPDVIYGTHKPSSDKYVLSGAMIAFDDMKEYMPNYNAWVDSLSEEEYDNLVGIRLAHDGKVYFSPVVGREMSQNVRAWLYRKDIFDKHGIAVPTTFDELYEVCKQLKALYPDSYPFSVRGGINVMAVTGSSWKPYWQPAMYYDYNAEKWSYGMTEDIMLENIKFYKKLIDEKLMPSDFMTINNVTWQELITTDRGFIMPEYQTRIDFFNSIGRSNNPEFDLHAMVPPVATEEGLPMVAKYNLDPNGIQIPNNMVESRIANAAKFVDWFYSDEAVELVSWGKEGETFEVIDGKKQYITDENGTQANTLYGFGTHGTFTRMDPEAVLAFESADLAETRDMVLEHTMPKVNPTLWLSFSEEEYDVKEQYEAALSTHTSEMVSKFLLGQEPLSKWDEFVETLYNDMHLEELLTVYRSAYDRVK